jgi:hypothetical protein
MRNVVAAVLTLSLMVFCSAQGRLPRRIIIFADVTSSLGPDQMAVVQTIVDDIVKNAPAGAELVVVPICENTQGVGQYRTSIPSPKGFTRQDLLGAETARANVQSEVKAFIKRVQSSAGAKADYASCISPALRIAQNAIAADGADRRNTDVIFVSDMVEECRVSILGGPIRLKLARNQFATASRLAGEKRRLLALGDARVFVILPKTELTGSLPADVPSPSDLQSFWESLFSRSGVAKNRLTWDAVVSDYVLDLRRSPR